MSKIKNFLRKIRDKLVGRVNLTEEQVSQIIIDKIRSGGYGWRERGYSQFQH